MVWFPNWNVLRKKWNFFCSNSGHDATVGTVYLNDCSIRINDCSIRVFRLNGVVLTPTDPTGRALQYSFKISENYSMMLEIYPAIIFVANNAPKLGLSWGAKTH